MKRLCVFSAILFLLSLPSAHAQLGLYAGFSAANINGPNEPWFYGTTFGAYYNVAKLPIFKFGFDGEAAILHGSGSSSPQKIVSGLVGPRAELHLPLIPLKPYVAGHLGGSNIQVGEGFSRTERTAFTYGFAAGADLTVFPGVDWRVIQYSYTRSEVLDVVDQSTLTTGLVIRLPVP